METLLINEQLVCQFKYWHEGQLRTGMRFRNSLFEFVARLAADQRLQVFDLADQLVQAQKC
jgi:hypothetical protein